MVSTTISASMASKLPQLKANARAAGWISEWTAHDERALLDGCWWDEEAAENWCGFFHKWLRFTMGEWAGQPFRLLDWQRDDVVRPLFGWKRADGLRRYAKGDIFVAKKQGKSTLCGGLANAFLMKGGRRTEVYGVAHTREQAGVVFREAAAMAKHSPALAKRLKVMDSTKRIVYAKTGSFYHVLAGENGVRGLEGINPLLTVFDEIHVQRSRTLYDTLTYASAARDNSLLLSVSTVGVADETTIWWEQYQYAKGVLSGEIHDVTRFAYICQADPECKDDPELRRDPKQWAKAMPSLGVTVKEYKVRDALREAENCPPKLHNFVRYILNIPTATVESVVPMDKWKACEGELPDLMGRQCWAGLDMASREDLTALVLYFPPIDDEKVGYIKSFFWAPGDKMREREQKQQMHYTEWSRGGWLTVIPGFNIKHEVIEQAIRDCVEKYEVIEVPYDKWNADATITPLVDDGVECVLIEQGMKSMGPLCQSFLDAIQEQKIRHDGNPVMSWCLSNAAAILGFDGVSWRFDKKKSADKIDGAIAGAMAVGRAMVAEPEEDDPYETDSLYDSPTEEHAGADT